MRYSNTNSVQTFIRFLSFLVTFIVLFVIIGLPLMTLSQATLIPSLIIITWVASIISKMFYILPEWERMVVLRLGKFQAVQGPGFFVIPPFVYSVAAILDTRIETHQVEATATLTKDNVPTKVTAAVEFRVEDAKKATIDVQNYRQSVIWLSTEALKNTIGNMDLKQLLSDRDDIAKSLKLQIDEGAAVYGVDVRAVRITDIDTPQTLVEELAAIAQARRAAEAKQIQAEAELMVAEKLAEASKVLGTEGGLKLRELQVLSEMSQEESSMIIIYPYGDKSGEAIASASVARHRVD